ncbi:MAG: GC-type dockerin domain-anchored protein [Phycisphaerales bacterium]
MVIGIGLSTVLGWSGTANAAPVDFQITDDADYTRLVDSIRATEYFREDYIVQDRNRRVVATIAALSAYAQINPHATATQLIDFANEYDAQIQADYPGDPDLHRSANMMTAVRFTIVDLPSLAGTDTEVGPLAAQYLDIVVPGPDNFEATRKRMVRFGQGLAMRYTHHTGLSEMLVSGFFGLTQDSVPVDGLSDALNQYLSAQGYTPSFGQPLNDPRFDGVNAGLALLPADYAGYSMALNQSLVSNSLVGMVDAQTQLVQAEIDSRVATIDDAILAEPTLVEGFAMGQDQAILDQLADDLRAQLQETSLARSSMFGATFMLGQSPLDELGNYSTATIEYNALLLESSDTMAEVQLGLGVASNLATLAAAGFAGDPVSAVGAVFGLVSDGIGIADHAGAFGNTPSVDEQIYAQLIELRMQVETMRQEMHARFDRIEAQLNFMYDQMVVGFNAIGNAIGDLGNQNDAILREMHIVRSQLSQLESALFGVAQDILLTDLTDAANTVLDYRDENNIDLAYSNQNPSFVTASVDFFTFATTTAQSQAFSGSRDNPSVTLTTAADYLDGTPIARYLNDLAVLPQSLGLAPLTFSTLVGPEPWAQASSAYVQLIKENPWYFSFRYQSQLEDYLADPQNESLPELDQLIDTGEQLVSFGNAARDPALFDALIDRYKQQVGVLQNEVNSVFYNEMVTLKLRATINGQVSMVHLWSPEGAQAGVETLFPVYNPSHVPDFAQMDDSSPDWGGSASILDVEPSLSYFQKATIVAGEHADYANKAVMFEYLNSLDANPKYDHEIRWDAFVPPPLLRGFFVHPPEFTVTHWVDVNSDPNIEDMQPIYQRQIESNMYVVASFGGPVTLPLDLYYNENDPRECAYPMFTAGGGRDVAWSNYEQAMPFGNIEGMDLRFTNVIPNDFEWAFDCANWMDLDSVDYIQFLPYTDTSAALDQTGILDGNIFEMLTHYREDLVRPLINAEFADPISPISQAMNQLDHTVALINAYLTIAAPEAMSRSEVLRSALRAAPGAGELGLRADDVIALILDFQANADARDPRSPADETYDFHVIDQILDDRIDFVHDEINRAIEMPLESVAYVEWMLAELNDARDLAFTHAHDDGYLASGALSVDAAGGLLSNDILQEYRVIEVDLGSTTQPSHGNLNLNADGSFVYTPDAGFVGQDSFTYQLVGTVIEGTPIPADGQFVTDPATVVISVESGACSAADFTEDGIIDFFDISIFLQAFAQHDPIADLTNDQIWDFFDVSTFLQLYAAGCP